MLYPNKNYPVRTTQSVQNESLRGTFTSPSNGIRGRTILSEKIDFPDAIPIDSMHLVFLGLFKSIIKHLLEDSGTEYYIGENKQTINTNKSYIIIHTF